jgi:hypothetical protein
MKIRELKENESLEVIEVTLIYLIAYYQIPIQVNTLG